MKLPASNGLRFFATAAAALLILGSPSSAVSEPGKDPGKTKKAPRDKISRAIALLQPTRNNTAKGTVQYESTGEGMKITAEVSGLTPGKHGFHIHEYGDCSAPDATSAGGHFSPTDTMHGRPDEKKHHLGDMGNIEADDQGNASLTLVDKRMSFKGRSSILGRAVIIHEKPDSFTQPSGAAGARIACGVIGVDGDVS